MPHRTKKVFLFHFFRTFAARFPITTNFMTNFYYCWQKKQKKSGALSNNKKNQLLLHLKNPTNNQNSN